MTEVFGTNLTSGDKERLRLLSRRRRSPSRLRLLLRFRSRLRLRLCRLRSRLRLRRPWSRSRFWSSLRRWSSPRRRSRSSRRRSSFRLSSRRWLRSLSRLTTSKQPTSLHTDQINNSCNCSSDVSLTTFSFCWNSLLSIVALGKARPGRTFNNWF